MLIEDRETRLLRWRLEMAERLLCYVVRQAIARNMWPYGETPEEEALVQELKRWWDAHKTPEDSRLAKEETD